MVLTFNALLHAAEIDPATTLLLRHSDARAQRRLYEAAIEADPRFDDYQRRQVRPNVIASFDDASHAAAFVVDHGGNTVFAGVWGIMGRSDEVIPDPFVGPDQDGESVVVYRTRRVDLLDQYRGRVVVDWGGGFLKWCQRAHLRTKPVVEIRRDASEPPFPGFGNFQVPLCEVPNLPASWAAILAATGGVYLLVHRGRGQQYVGSAYGSGGFYGRWCCYQNGHGGNVALRELAGKPEDYEVTILETAGSAVSESEIIAAETRWKRKLGSRLVGLNRN